MPNRFRLLDPAQHPDLVQRGDIDTENLRQPPHFQRLVLQNGADQLVDRDCAVLSAPDVDADTHGIRCLLRQLRTERLADLESLSAATDAADRRGSACRSTPHPARNGHGVVSAIQQRQTPLDPLADAVLRSARPCSKIQDSTLVRAQHRRTAQLRTEHLQGRADRLLVVRHGRDPRQNVRHERDVCRPVAVNALRHVGDEVAVPQMPLSLRHTDQDEIVRICDLDEPRSTRGRYTPT